MKKSNKEHFLCNNRQCRACKYISMMYSKGSLCWCNYMCMTGQARLCPIPFCEKFERAKGKKAPKHLTTEDFKEYYAAYPEEKEKQSL